MVLIEKHLFYDWEPTDDRGQRSKTRNGTEVTVYPESSLIKINGTSSQLSRLEPILNKELDTGFVPPTDAPYLDPALAAKTRGYIEKIVNQTNACYAVGAYDGASVLLRRLTETLIIECFEKHGIDAKIKDGNGHFYQLAALIAATITESDAPTGAWNLSQNGKQGLQSVKQHGDLSAHNRKYFATKSDVDGLKTPCRVLVEELLTVAGLR